MKGATLHHREANLVKIQYFEEVIVISRNDAVIS
jgi:hypothetical protein